MTPAQALQHAPLAQLHISDGVVQYRRGGSAGALTHVLLHGIGSASASWAYQLVAPTTQQVWAWDAPGYGASTPLPLAQPVAADYARVLWAALDALQVTTPLTLVGHSLGALMAAAAARMQPHRVREVVLLAPARGYGQDSDETRLQVLQNRLDALQRLGPLGLAQARAAALLTPDARTDWVDAVRESMAQIHPTGYTQAVQLLVGGRLIDDVRALSMPVRVASGDADGITPVSACDAVADAAGCARISLGAVGHACALQASAQVNALLGLPVVAV